MEQKSVQSFMKIIFLKIWIAKRDVSNDSNRLIKLRKTDDESKLKNKVQ